LFNLLLNAVQAADQGGDIQVAAARILGTRCGWRSATTVMASWTKHQTEIFKPYFTTHQQCTRLGIGRGAADRAGSRMGDSSAGPNHPKAPSSESAI
jgi:hypothetical protein